MKYEYRAYSHVLKRRTEWMSAKELAEKFGYNRSYMIECASNGRPFMRIFYVQRREQK